MFSERRRSSGFTTFNHKLIRTLNRTLATKSQYKDHLTSIGIIMLKIRRSRDRLIINMGILIPGKDGLYIETRPGPPHRKDINLLLFIRNHTPVQNIRAYDKKSKPISCEQNVKMWNKISFFQDSNFGRLSWWALLFVRINDCILCEVFNTAKRFLYESLSWCFHKYCSTSTVNRPPFH